MSRLNRATNSFHGCLQNTPASWRKQQPLSSLFSVISLLATPMQAYTLSFHSALELHPRARDWTKCDCPSRRRLLTQLPYEESNKHLNWLGGVIILPIIVFPAFRRIIARRDGGILLT